MREHAPKYKTALRRVGEVRRFIFVVLRYRRLINNRDLERESLHASTLFRVHCIHSLCNINFILVSHGKASEHIILPADTSVHASLSLTYLQRVRENWFAETTVKINGSVNIIPLVVNVIHRPSRFTIRHSLNIKELISWLPTWKQDDWKDSNQPTRGGFFFNCIRFPSARNIYTFVWCNPWCDRLPRLRFSKQVV